MRKAERRLLNVKGGLTPPRWLPGLCWFLRDHAVLCGYGAAAGTARRGAAGADPEVARVGGQGARLGPVGSARRLARYRPARPPGARGRPGAAPRPRRRAAAVAR